MMATAVASQTLTLTETIQAPAAQVYKSFTNKDWIRDWFSDDADVRAVEGGHILFTWYTTGYHAFGTFTTLEENKKIAFTWRGAGEDEDSTIEIILDENGDSTTMTFVHDRLAEGGLETFKQEWSSRLENLKIALETGADGRLTNRVILGIIPDNFDASVAKELNVPVEHGARIGTTLEGLGAAKAGLQGNDVIVKVAGNDLTPDHTIYNAVVGKKPGDEVDVVYYRDGKKHETTMPLSGYPIPEVPESFAALGDRMAELYGQVMADVEGTLKDVSEEAAAKKADDDTWSANEVLAHLILSQRWMNNWLGGILQGPEIDGWTNNSDARIRAVVETYGSKDALVAELQRIFDETSAILRHVPAEFNERKTNLWWMSFEVQSFMAHVEQHVRQLKATVA